MRSIEMEEEEGNECSFIKGSTIQFDLRLNLASPDQSSFTNCEIAQNIIKFIFKVTHPPEPK